MARQFPTSLNPNMSVELCPWVFGVSASGGTQLLESRVNVSWAQPIELGSRTAERTAIAHAEYQQTYWTVVQAELLALVETYRAYETAIYRRGKVQVARDLADLNDRLVGVLRRQLEANQVAVANALLAEVENETAQQRVEIARQEYADALAALRQQMGEVQLADSAEPDATLAVPQEMPVDVETATRIALAGRPEIQSARAAADRSNAAVAAGPRRPDADFLAGAGLREGRVRIEFLRHGGQYVPCRFGTTAEGWFPSAKPSTPATLCSGTRPKSASGCK